MEDLDVRLLVDLLRDRIHLNRSLGQHFLLDEKIISRAVEIAGNQDSINSSSHVLEIGPGPGSLTLELLRKGAKVTAIEIDNEAVSHLNRVFADSADRLDVQLADALESEWPNDITHIVANLPYQISSPIIERIQKHHAKNPLVGIALLVQDEFAERMAMVGGHSSRGPLGHSLWLQFDVKLDSKVPSHSFSPAPKVNSRLVSLMPVDRSEISQIDNRLFRMVITQCFSNRRRKLRTLLSKPPRRINRIPSWYRDRWLGAIKKLPDETLERRPENLTSIEWVKLIENISNE